MISTEELLDFLHLLIFLLGSVDEPIRYNASPRGRSDDSEISADWDFYRGISQ